MAHWFHSNFPWKTFGVYSILVMAASFRWGLGGFVLGVYFGFIGFFGYSCIFFGNNTKVFNGIIEEILIPEFIEKRPFREIT